MSQQDIQQLHKKAEELERLLRLQSFPVGVKLLKGVDEMPEGAQRPMKDMGYHLSLCQAIALARRNGMTVCETKEDMWCFEPVLALGFEKPPQRFLDGYNRYPFNSSSLEAGAEWARNFPMIEHGQYSAIVIAPLGKINFQPDIFLLYGEPYKMRMILTAKLWLDGKDITPTVSPNAACCYSVVPTVKDRVWQIAFPCYGDTSRAACNFSEMIFSAPIEILDDLLRGLRASEERGHGMPQRVDMLSEYPAPESYVEIGKLIGMDWVK